MNDINLWVRCYGKVKWLLFGTVTWFQPVFTQKEDSSRGPLVTILVNFGYTGLIVVDPCHGTKLKNRKRLPKKILALKLPILFWLWLVPALYLKALDEEYRCYEKVKPVKKSKFKITKKRVSLSLKDKRILLVQSQW